MADFTPSYAANIAVRAFLTKITEMLLGEVFNHSRVDNPEGKPRIFGKQEWGKIKDWFGNTCAYCGQLKELTVDHLAMFNRSQGGLQHPRNVVPSCRSCNNNRRPKGKKKDDEYYTWEQQLWVISGRDQENYERRKKTIDDHIREYPSNSGAGDEDELLAVGEHYISAANDLYDKVRRAIGAAQCEYVKPNTLH